MRNQKTLLFSLCLLLLDSAHAELISIIGFSLGAKNTANAKNEIVNFTVDEFGSDVINAYVPNKNSKRKFTGNIHGGFLFQSPSPKIKLTTELAFYFPQTRSFTGQVWEAGIPDFDNFTYSYNVSSRQLMFESRIIYPQASWLPYVSVGIGPSWNKAYAYQEYPNNETAISLKGNFPSNTNTTFPYEAGAGLGYTYKKLLVAFEYKYQILGDAQFGLYSFQTNNNRLNSRLRTNQFLVNLSYLI